MFRLLALHKEVFGQERVFVRAVLLVISEIFAFSGLRVTDLLRAVGLVGEDWSAWYRVFEKPGRFLEEQAGEILLGESLRHVEVAKPYVIGADTTQVWRDSHKMEGTSWLKCPRTAPFRVGIHLAQRFLNGSWLTPLRFLAAFPEKAVLKAHEPCKEYEAGLQFVQWVRLQLNKHARQQQEVLCLADGAYEKVEFWRNLPEGVFALIRTAKNRALCYLPGEYAGKGRRRLYGDDAPAPQDYNKLRSGWQTAHLTVRGRSRRTVYRVEGPFLRRGLPTFPSFSSPCAVKSTLASANPNAVTLSSIWSMPAGKTTPGNSPSPP